MHCPEKKEGELLRFCKKYLSRKACRDIFVLTYERMRRYEGAWHTEVCRMFPGYVFLECEDGELLLGEWENCKDISALYGAEFLPEPVEPGTERLLRQFFGECHFLGMSRGYIRDGKTYVTEGPLKGMEGLIRRIDRHKRLARIGLPGMKDSSQMYAGLEIVGKS